MPELAAFQSEFALALLDPRSGAAERHGRGLAVHQNTTRKGLIDALAANFPTVEELVGRDWFRACASEFVDAQPPRSAVLALYGKEFPAFLAGFPPAAELPYLCEVAQIDRLWLESHFARDAWALPADALARLSSSELFEQRASIHPAARFGRFRSSAVTIWKHHRSAPRDRELEIDGRAESAVLTRPRGTVECLSIDSAGLTFLEQVRGGATLGEAATAVLKIDRATDVAAHLARFIAAGVFSKLIGDRL